MALERDIKSLIFNIYKGQEANDIVERLKTITEGQKISDILSELQSNSDKFLSQYEQVFEQIAFANNGILDGIGLDIDTFYSLDKETQRELVKSNSLNLLSPTQLNHILAKNNYDIDQIKFSQQIGKYFGNDEKLFREYISTYRDFQTSMIQGYETLIKIGQEIRETKNFDYIVGFFKGQGLEHLLSLTESQMHDFMSDYRFFGTHFTNSGDIALGFNSDINREKAFRAMQSLINNKQDQLLTEKELQQSFSFLKDFNIISATSGEKITSNARLLEVLMTNGVVEQLQDVNNNIVGYKMHRENLSFLAGSDIMLNGVESSVKSIKGSGHNADFVNLSTLINGLTMFSSQENIEALVDDALTSQLEPFSNKSDFIYEEAEEAAIEAMEQDMPQDDFGNYSLGEL